MELGDGGTSTGAGITHSYPEREPCAVTLTVLDSDGQAATSIANIIVNPPALTAKLRDSQEADVDRHSRTA